MRFSVLFVLVVAFCSSVTFCGEDTKPVPQPKLTVVPPPPPIELSGSTQLPVIVEGGSYTDVYNNPGYSTGGGYMAGPFVPFDPVTEAKAAKLIFPIVVEHFEEMKAIEGLQLASFTVMAPDVISVEWTKGNKRFRADAKMTKAALSTLAYKVIDASREVHPKVRQLLFQKAAQVMAASEGK